MKREYITPKVEIEELEDLMDNQIINVSDEWNDCEGAKRNNSVFDDSDIEEESSPGLFSGSF